MATADSAAAVHYNPAGMTQLEGPEGQAGVYAIVLGNEAESGGVKTAAKKEFQAVPHLYYAQPWDDRLSFGFGLNCPFGLGTDWGRDTPVSPVVTEGHLLYLSATAAAAWKVTDELSLGASVSVNHADLTLERGVGVPGSYLRFSGEDLGVSGALAIRWQPHEQHAFGGIFATQSTFGLSGETTTNVPGWSDDGSAGMDFMTPARMACGYSYRPAAGWNIEANVEWLNWDSLNTLQLETTAIPGSGSLPVTFDWKSSFIYELGVSYTSPQGYVWAAGYDFNENSQPDAHYTPGVADADLQWINLGFGRKGGRYSWMLAYQFGVADRTVDGAMNPAANRHYEARHHAMMFSWRQSF